MNIHSAFVITLITGFFVTAHASQPIINLDAFNQYMFRCIKTANRYNCAPHFPRAHLRSHEDLDIAQITQALKQDNPVRVRFNNTIQHMQPRDLTTKVFEIYMLNSVHYNKFDLNNPAWMQHYFTDFSKEITQAFEDHGLN